MTIFRHRLAALSVFALLVLVSGGRTVQGMTPADSASSSRLLSLPQGDDPKKGEGEAAAESKGEEKKQEEPKQEEPAASSPLLEARHKLTEAEIGKFEPLLRAVLDDPGDPRNFKALDEELGAFEKDKGYTALGDPEAWRNVFENRFVDSIKKNRVNGAGRVQEDVVLLPVKGELYAFEYAYIIPRDYDHAQRWPVLLCLHDKGSDGKNYLDKIWQAAKEDKELCKGFILVAPDLREKTLEKKFSREGKSVEKRIEWFDLNFLRSILLPLSEIRKNFHCDPQRIFIEGTGAGADAAIEFAAIAPGRFAGVINRNGSMRDTKVLPGLQGTKVLVVHRNGDDKYKGKDMLAALEKASADQIGVDLEVFAGEAVERVTPMMKGGQDVDPVIEANAAVAAFIAKHTLEAYPTSLRIVSSATGAFKSHPLVKITSFDDEKPENYIDLKMTFDRAKNRIVVVGKSFFAFTVFLNDQILDLDKPIEVTINGATLDNRTATRGVKQMVSDMRGKPYDYHQVLPALLILEIPDEPVKEAAPKEGEKTDEKAAGKSDSDKKE